jgi:hypothetical protein
MLEKWKATCNFNLSNLIGSQKILKKTAALVMTMISLLNALLLTIQTHTSTVGDVLVVCSAKDEAQEWKASIGGSDDRE